MSTSSPHAPPKATPTARPRGRRLVALAAAALVSAGTAAAQEARGTIPFSEIRAGMKGFGRTVFSGMKVEPFEVEVIGTMTNIAPRRNVILARLTGGPLAQTGILEGMSGSPVYIDGKLAGAIAYSWGFSKEPICGITPIGEMLDLLKRDAATGRAAASPRRGLPASPALLAEPARVTEFLRGRLLALASPASSRGLTPLRIPLVLGGGFRRGASGETLRLWEEAFSSFGLSPMRAGGAGSGSDEETPLEPGSAVAVQLVRGDIEVAAIGTATYVHDGDVLAFGHPFFLLGPTALPMTRAVVHGVLPSLASSFKLASATGPVGLITQDRFAGLSGSLGGSAPIVPVKINLTSEGDRTEAFTYEIVEDPLITPILLQLTLLEILATAEKQVGDTTLLLQEGSQIRIEGGLDVKLQNLYSGGQSELIATATVAYMTYLLMNNPDRLSRVEGIDLDLGYSDSRRLARIDRIWCDSYTVAPGNTLPLYVSVSPFRGDQFTEVIPLEIPEEAPEGKAILQVGDALTLSRMEYASGGVSFQPTRLEQLVSLLNRIRVNSRIYATLIRPDNGAFISGERLPNLPPSIVTILFPTDRDQAGAAHVRLRGLLEAERETPYALRGYQRTILEIKR